ncbi:MAG: pyruvate, phosphate dikinase [Pseudomonadota bacterium]
MNAAPGIGWIGPASAGDGAAGDGAMLPAATVLPTDQVSAARFGPKAAWLAAAAALGLPVPPAVVLDAETVADPAARAAALATGIARIEAATGRRLGAGAEPLLLAVRPSALPGTAGGEGDGGGIAPSILNVGASAAALDGLAARYGAWAAADLCRRLAQAWGASAAGLDDEDFEYALHDALRREGVDDETALSPEALRRLATEHLALAAEAGCPLPDAPRDQALGAVAGLWAAWSGPRARNRRLARGGEPDAGLPVIVQAMVVGLGAGISGAGISGAGVAGLRDEETGAPRLAGRYLACAQGEEALMGLRTPVLLTVSERLALGQRSRTLEETAPGATEALAEAGRRLERALGDAFSLDFTLEDGALWLTELRLARRSARAAVRIAVDLADMGALTRDAALMRVDPSALEAHLHPTIDESAARDTLGRGLAASPGAASGPLVFSPEDAEAAAAGGRPAILALVETSPEDIRGMHAAGAVLTVRGGMTSHAAVVARGLGKPCVVGARTLRLDRRNPGLIAADGRRFEAGAVLTVDGGAGEVIAGEVPTRPPEITGAFGRLMGWADARRRLGVRANADTATDARVARGFEASGIGLCRTEHMFFPSGRISAMRRMILATSAEDRRAALAELHPMQQGDFRALFLAMPGQSVTIRLLDPPLHEFLPHGAADIAELGRALGLPSEEVQARAKELAEFNPMLGKRGCRVGIAYPEIYEMQVRAILEGALEAGSVTGAPVVPEIMIPLISSVRELEVLRARIDAVAEAVRAERAAMVDYRVGVMLETPRACLRAGEIAEIADFISFGTNDLTQMVYGLSRDDAGRFMHDYVAQEIYRHDPFHSLDYDGVGEMMQIATARARGARPGISVGLCGEQGADARSVAFCEAAGFDYVSCSPYRVPIARLAAAQAAILHEKRANGAATWDVDPAAQVAPGGDGAAPADRPAATDGAEGAEATDKDDGAGAAA